jgi:hypothetical protein
VKYSAHARRTKIISIGISRGSLVGPKALSGLPMCQVAFGRTHKDRPKGNMMFRQYDRIYLKVAWDAVEQDLPQIKAAVEMMLRGLESNDDARPDLPPSGQVG